MVKVTFTPAQSQLLTVVREGMSPSISAPQLHLDMSGWRDLLVLADTQKLLPLIAPVIVRLPEQSRPSDRVVSKLREAAAGNVRAGHMIAGAISVMATTLRTQAIPYMILKGASYATLYTDPHMRQCGDIDVYVAPADFDNALRLLTAEGFEPMHTSAKHISGRFHGCDLELHHKLMVFSNPSDDCFFSRWVDETAAKGLRSVNGCGGVFTVPPAIVELVHCFTHMRHHFMTSGVGLRQMCDWTLLLKTFASEVYHDELREVLSRLHVYNDWRKFITIAVNYLGLPQSSAPFFDSRHTPTGDRLLRIMLEEGNFGAANTTLRPDATHYWRYKAKRLIATQRRLISLLSLMPGATARSTVSFWRAGVKRVIDDKM